MCRINYSWILWIPILPVTASVGDQIAQVQYAGGAPGEVAGVIQINVKIPRGVQAGSAVPISVQVGRITSQAGVTIRGGRELTNSRIWGGARSPNPHI
jgi:uncharacterized protein (TIGR03437 family)